MELPDRLRSRVAVNQATGCWEWTGAKTIGGYGQVYTAAGNAYAHRLSYEWCRGPIPEGLELDHLCRNHSCCNPDHLEAVTHAENMRRSAQAQATHCKRGHEYTPENTRFAKGRKPGQWSRACRTCDRLTGAQRRAAGRTWIQRQRAARKAALYGEEG